jgi:hypothetical protein
MRVWNQHLAATFLLIGKLIQRLGGAASLAVGAVLILWGLWAFHNGLIEQDSTSELPGWVPLGAGVVLSALGIGFSFAGRAVYRRATLLSVSAVVVFTLLLLGGFVLLAGIRFR